ncbi:MAG: S8 family serine peptidase, partial [Verrucomicrobia bacterium]|nr:S8 family serine peptidase [Verrucomicrobiota bacterium]
MKANYSSCLMAGSARPAQQFIPPPTRRYTWHFWLGALLATLATASLPRATAGSAVPGALTPPHPAPPPADFRADRILVKPKPGIGLDVLANLHARLGTHVRRTFAHIGNWQVIDLPFALDVNSILAAYRQSGLVEHAEPDYVVTTLLTPNDFNYYNGDQWNLNNVGQYGGTPGADIHAPAGWDYQCTASNIIVAIPDTGVRYTHEDLAANMWTCPGGTNHGINVLTRTDDPWDDEGHGTHVSGIVGAVGNNTVGIAGVCWHVQLLECKFIDSSGNGTVSDAITCLDYAMTNGAKIINASWGSYSFTSTALQDTVNALRDQGIIFVAAAGNNNNNNDSYSLYPASYPYDNVIAVAATDRNDHKASFSNYGATTVLLGAPGDPVFSTYYSADNAYEYMAGTSQAAPQVVGACALVWALYPNLTHQQVIRRVLEGVDPLPSLAGLCVTGGRLDLANALAPQPAPTVPPLTVWCDDALPPGAVPESGSGGSWTGDPWNWVTNNPPPYSGTVAHQSGLISGIHMHY